METRRAYATMVGDPATGLTLEIATIRLASVADSRITSIAQVLPEEAVRYLEELVGTKEARIVATAPLNSPSSPRGRADFNGFVTDTLFSSKAVRGSRGKVSALVDELFGAAVLAEHPTPKTVGGAAAVGAVSAKGITSAMVAVAGVGSLTGSGAAVVLLGPAGILIVGTGIVTWLASRLLTQTARKR